MANELYAEGPGGKGEKKSVSPKQASGYCPKIETSGTHKGMFYIRDLNAGRWMNDKGEWRAYALHDVDREHGFYFASHGIAQATIDRFRPPEKKVSVTTDTVSEVKSVTVDKKALGFDDWLAEYYPETAEATVARTKDPVELLEHSLLHWKGLRPDVLEKFGLYADGSWIKTKGDNKSILHVGADTCTLCHAYRTSLHALVSPETCGTCPIWQLQPNCCGGSPIGPWPAWKKHNDPEPMFALLCWALDKAKQDAQYVPLERRAKDHRVEVGSLKTDAVFLHPSGLGRCRIVENEHAPSVGGPWYLHLEGSRKGQVQYYYRSDSLAIVIYEGPERRQVTKQPGVQYGGLGLAGWSVVRMVRRAGADVPEYLADGEWSNTPGLWDDEAKCQGALDAWNISRERPNANDK